MSHSTISVGDYHAEFQFDFSGEVHIIEPTGRREVYVPMALLEAVVAEKVRRERIAQIKDAKPEDLLR
jgi:hypothetical protein